LDVLTTKATLDWCL